MSRLALKKALTNFFDKANTQKVMVIKGDWGVGKSYYIESLLKEIGSEYECPIAITSLFGVSSFSQSIERLHYPVKSKASAFKNILQSISSVRKLIPFELPSGVGLNINVENLFQIVLSSLLKNGILIVDDIERKSDALGLDDILGSISYLSEKQMIKVVLVFSENNLCKNDRSALSRLREKTIDVEFEFKPCSEENAKLITSNQVEIDVIKNIGVNNIRIIKKIFRAYFDLIHGFGVDDNLKHLLYQKIGALCYVHYSKNGSISLDDVSKHIKYLIAKDPESVLKASELNALKYHYDKRDSPIIDYLKNGSLNESAWLESIQSYKSDVQSDELNESLKRVWSVFNSNFNSGFKETTEKFEEFLNQRSADLWPTQVLEMQNMLSEIGYDISDKTWLEVSLNNHLDSITSSDIESVKAAITNRMYIDKLEKAVSSRSGLPSLEDAIKTIVYKQSWGQEDAYVVQNSSKESYRDWMMNSSDVNLLTDIRKAYKLFNGFGADYTNAVNNLYEGAKLIEEQSEDDLDKKLNQHRIKMFLKNGT